MELGKKYRYKRDHDIVVTMVGRMTSGRPIIETARQTLTSFASESETDYEELPPEQWVNLYWKDDRELSVESGSVFDSESEARRGTATSPEYIMTIKLENKNGTL